jgi:tetratricopeptide (TPR) repeat protein/predicted aspartyl protease
MRVGVSAALLLGAALSAGLSVEARGAEPCRVSVVAELPVTMAGRRPMVSAKFGDKSVRFILDSGAFYSALSRASAQEFGLQIRGLDGFRVSGIGGDTAAGAAVAKNFSLAGIPFPKVDFVVAGSDTGTAGLIGQNILGLMDVEYDLPHGVVRLVKTQNCKGANPAYWTGERPFSVVKLVRPPSSLFKPHTVAQIAIDGQKVAATFDTGADESLLAASVAKRLGAVPGGDTVTEEGLSGGLGSRHVRTYRATFNEIEVGGELLKKPKIQFADMGMSDTQMLVGVDFFLTHRIFVANAQNEMFFTYEGGPLFGLNPRRAVTAGGAVIALSDKTPQPTDAAGYSRRGAAAASNKRYAEAIADFDKAIALTPGEGHYRYQRAMANFSIAYDKRGKEPTAAETVAEKAGAADLDRAIDLSPNDVDARMLRASRRLRDEDRMGARVDLRAVDAALAPQSDRRLSVAGMLTDLGEYDRAIANYDSWFKAHPEDSSRAGAFNGRCWARALAARELDQALNDCNAALRLRKGDASTLDSRALVRLRAGEWKQAVADYDAALKNDPDNAWSRYARGVALTRGGDAKRGSEDHAAAIKLDEKIEERAKRYNLTY